MDSDLLEVVEKFCCNGEIEFLKGVIADDCEWGCYKIALSDLEQSSDDVNWSNVGTQLVIKQDGFQLDGIFIDANVVVYVNLTGDLNLISIWDEFGHFYDSVSIYDDESLGECYL